ncbi:MAG: hypothetical protein ACOX2A_00760 [Tepidanaerobacteraceae bacterium]
MKIKDKESEVRPNGSRGRDIIIDILGILYSIGFSLLVIVKLWTNSKDKSFIWFIAQLIFLYMSFSKFTYSIRTKPGIPQVMLSEENSLALGISGILWAVSMFCMLKGIWNMGTKNRIKTHS